MSKLLEQKVFLTVIQKNIDAVCGLDAAFSLICIEPRAEENSKYSTKEALGVISASIAKSIVKENDYYSFFDNKFYIFTSLQIKAVIRDFINSIAAKVGIIYGLQIYINAGVAQYPYDAMNIRDIFSVVISNMDKIILKKYDIETGLVSEKDPNYILGVELTKYMTVIKNYSEILYNHSFFVAKICFELAKKFKFANQAIKKLTIASILHDIGYTMIPKEIFGGDKQLKIKNSKTIKLHPLFATRRILFEKYIFRDVFDLIEQHHEFLDGGGYPFGLSRVDLSFDSQIISLADTYAIFYDQGFSKAAIIEFLYARSGIRWEAELVEAFAELLNNEKNYESIHNINYGSLKDIFDF